MKLDVIVDRVLNDDFICTQYKGVTRRLAVRLLFDASNNSEAIILSGSYGIIINFVSNKIYIKLGKDNEFYYSLDPIDIVPKTFDKIPSEPDEVFNFKLISGFDLNDNFKLAMYKLCDCYNKLLLEWNN